MDEIKIGIPANYGSIEGLDHWLKINIPHEYHIDGGPRWRIVSGNPAYIGPWHIAFTRASDASLFLLKWE